MLDLKVGDQVSVPCDVKPGPFSDELLVTIETIDGPIAGFVQKSELTERQQQSYVKALVKALSLNHIEVWLKGEFFQTAGLASVERNRAIAA